MVLKAWDILSERLQVLSSPATLEALAGYTVHRHADIFKINQLPLPHVIIDNIRWRQYQHEVKEHNFEADYTFYSHDSKALPVILWDHVGHYIITEWDHPYPM